MRRELKVLTGTVLILVGMGVKLAAGPSKALINAGPATGPLHNAMPAHVDITGLFLSR